MRLRSASKKCRTPMKQLTLCLISSLLLVMALGCSQSVQIIAHRGASYLAPENTKAAALLAWQKNADSVEIDVYLTSDKQIAVIHDASTKRTAGKDLSVKNSTFAQLRQLDVGSFKDKKYAGEPIPSLADIIETIPPGKTLFVEVKCGPEIIPFLKQAFADSNKADQIVIIGFSLDTIAKAKKAMPNIPVYWLKGSRKDEKTGKWIPYDLDLVQTAKAKGLDGLNLHNLGLTKEIEIGRASCRERV